MRFEYGAYANVDRRNYKTRRARFSGQQHDGRERDGNDVGKNGGLLGRRKAFDQRRLERNRQSFRATIRGKQENSKPRQQLGEHS